MRPSTDLSPDSLVDLPCACATVRRAARAVTQLYDGHLRATEIEGTQFALLSVLSSLGPCNQAAIGERFALDKTTLSRNLKLLKHKTWIEAAEAADGRERRYVLTAAGRKRLPAAKPPPRRAQGHAGREYEMTTSSRLQAWALASAMLAAPAAAQTPAPPAAFRDHPMLPRDLEIELALNAAPKHVRDGAAVLVLDSTGYVQAREG